MPAIERLPPSVVNKIAAGEVIERPASVVKELVENSLDAGAMRIDVTVEKGGLDLLRVTDDGGGIPADELPLAVAAHATSKIRTADDLFRVGTLGFRGEALASIAEVSRFLLRSRPQNASSGAEIEIIGGRPTDEASPVAPCGCPPGSTAEVRNLFFNTPVRRKFLKSVPTELGHVSEVVARLALAHPHVHFTFKHNNRVVYDLPPADDWRERIARLQGEDLARDLLWIERSDADGSHAGSVRLYGYVASPTKSRPNNKSQYLFLNGRYIRDRSLSHALSEGYRGLLLTGRFPVCFLCFEAPPDAVDVNVHPTKLEVRFQDGGRLYSLLLGTLRTRFLTSDLTTHWQGGGVPTSLEDDDPAAALDGQRAADVRHELVAWAKGKVAAWEEGAERTEDTSGGDSPPSSLLAPLDLSSPDAARFSQADFGFPAAQRGPLSLTRLSRLVGLTQSAVAADAKSNGGSPPRMAPRADEAPRLGPAGKAMQIHSRYLVAESEDGMVVIDQHALHERILYEQLRERVLAGALESQSLLVPETIDLAPADAAAVLEQQELLARLGIVVEPFGGDTVLVSSYPAILAGINIAELFQGVVEQLAGHGRPPERRDVLDELLHMMSCKAAIKAGDRLTPGEIEALLEQRHLAQDAHHCPHGRPTALVLTRAELDRQFLRT